MISEGGPASAAKAGTSDADGLDSAPRTVSIVVEWENADRIGPTRAERMLDELHRQVRDENLLSVVSWELIFVYDDAGELSKAHISGSVFKGGRTWPASVRYAGASGDYYEQKNHGAALATGEVIVFLDSDVVPGPLWLKSLLSAFADPAVDVVAGTTSVEVCDFYSGAMALGWFFPLPSSETRLTPAVAFPANNVAFRGNVFARFPFPRNDQHRGRCLDLAGILRAQGYGIYTQPSAAVTHPPPEWFGPFALRAMWYGHDVAVAGSRGRASFWRSVAHLLRGAASSVARIWVRRRRVNFSLLHAVPASGLLLLYHAIKAVGFLCCWLAPERTKRRLERLSSRTPDGGEFIAGSERPLVRDR